MNKLEEYLAFAKMHPKLFMNPSEGGFTILMDKDEIHIAEVEVGRRLETESLPGRWGEVGIAYQDQYIRIFRDAVRHPDGSLNIYTRYVGEEDGAPGVFALPLFRGYILLIRHFRHHTRAWHLEIPGGFGMRDKSSEETVLQELKEEIRASISRLLPLGQVYLDVYSSSDHVKIFFADIESYGEAEVQEGISEVLQVSVLEFEQMIRKNEITHMPAIIAYIRAKLQGLL